jgi:hypothetical protein
MSGMMARLKMALFTWPSRVSVKMANWLTSAPVPAVLGAQIKGGMG